MEDYGGVEPTVKDCLTVMQRIPNEIKIIVEDFNLIKDEGAKEILFTRLDWIVEFYVEGLEQKALLYHLDEKERVKVGCEKCKCKERKENDVCGISSLKCSDTSDEVCIKLYSLNKGYRKASKGVLR